MMDQPLIAQDFFKAGGTLHLHTPSYVSRPADEDFPAQLRAGRFCYVLTARQMGKSSLMIRTAERLQARGLCTSTVDLSGLGNQLTEEQWYLGIVKRLADDLTLSINAEEWWKSQAPLGPVQRFTDFLHDIVLAQVTGRIVIFIDEIDSTLSLSFTDDFFAAIRNVYNLRASEPVYERLTFALLGVASPADLIKDRRRTPFNIGQAIDLCEFRRADAGPMQRGLDRFYPGRGACLLDRVFYWTSGHPYLTQKLCLALVEEAGAGTDVSRNGSREIAPAAPGSGSGDDARVDALVERLFLAPGARNEDNLQFVRSNAEASPERRALLQLYRRVYTDQPVPEDRRSPLQNRLRLIGLVRDEGGVLVLRNEIYRRAFDLAWVQANTPLPKARLVTAGAILFSVVTLVAAFVILRDRQQGAYNVQLGIYKRVFHDAAGADRLNSLARICSLRPQGAQRLLFLRMDGHAAAQAFFFDELDPASRGAFFGEVNPAGATPDLKVVTDCLLPRLQSELAAGRAADVARGLYCLQSRVASPGSTGFAERLGHPYVCEAGEDQ